MLFTKKTRNLILLIIFLITVLAAWFYYNPERLQNILLPKVNGIEAADIRMSGDTAFAVLRLRLENKSFLKLTLDSLNCKIRIEGEELVDLHEHVQIAMPSGQKDTIDLPIAFPFVKLQEQIKKNAANDSMTIHADVKFLYNTRLGKMTLPVKKEFKIATPKPPEFEITQVEYSGFNDGEIELKVLLKMHNRGELALKVMDLKYDIKAGELVEAHGSWPDTATIDPRSFNTFNLPVRVKVHKPLKMLGLVLKDKDHVSYRALVSGSVVTNGEKPSEVTVSRTGKLELIK